MSSEQSSVNSETIEKTKQQIRALVGEISQLSKSDLSPEEYYAAFLQRIVSALAAVGGAVWQLNEGSRPQLVYQINLSETLLDAGSEDAVRHVSLLNYVSAQREPKLVPPNSGVGEQQETGNPTRYLLVMAPLESDNQIEAVVEIFQRPDSQPATQRGYLRFLVQMCELAGEWLKTQKLKQFSDRHSLWAQADHFARLAHDSLNLRETSYIVVNEGRRMIGCDRVAIGIMHGSKCKIEAVSGQDTFDNRSNVVTLLGKLATKVIATGETLWYEGSTEDMPPQIENAIEEYVDESYSKTIYILPLRRPKHATDLIDQANKNEVDLEENVSNEVIGAIIVEQIESDLPRELLTSRVDLVYEHTARAVANSLDYSTLFMMPIWRAISRAIWTIRTQALMKTLAISGAVLAVVLFLGLYPAKFDMKAKGALQPVIRQDVFTPLDGEVSKVFVDHGDFVKKGDDLAILRNTDLEVQRTSFQGRLETTKKQLATVQLSRAAGGQLSQADRIELAGEKLKLEQDIKSLREQLRLLDMKREKLKIKSPIDGMVTTWDVHNMLLHRPVMLGQVLMTIAQPEGLWELEVMMPERRMRHIAEERQGEAVSDAELAVTYILTTEPSTHRSGTVKEIHTTAQLDEQEGQTIRIRVDIDEESLTDPLPGTTVTARVHCGRRAIGYVWFHEAIEWAQSHWPLF